MTKKNSKPIGEPSPYLIHCVRDIEFGSCGTSTYLTEEQYDAQMRQPNRGWHCPHCNCYPCHWDDENYEKHMTKGARS